MGGIFSCGSKPKKTRRIKVNRVQPISDSDSVMKTANYNIFQVKRDNIEQEVVKTEESKALEDEGLVSKCAVYSSQGLAYEIGEKMPLPSAPPARLGEMLKTETKTPSSEEIKEKLLKAERRRKQLEEERVMKVKQMQKTESPGTINAFIHHQKMLEDQQTKKMDDAVASRQARLRLIRDRLKEKDMHAKSVRQRKFLSLDDMGPPPKEEKVYDFYNPS